MPERDDPYAPFRAEPLSLKAAPPRIPDPYEEFKAKPAPAALPAFPTIPATTVPAAPDPYAAFRAGAARPSKPGVLAPPTEEVERGPLGAVWQWANEPILGLTPENIYEFFGGDFQAPAEEGAAGAARGIAKGFASVASGFMTPLNLAFLLGVGLPGKLFATIGGRVLAEAGMSVAEIKTMETAARTVAKAVQAGKSQKEAIAALGAVDSALYMKGANTLFQSGIPLSDLLGGGIVSQGGTALLHKFGVSAGKAAVAAKTMDTLVHAGFALEQLHTAVEVMPRMLDALKDGETERATQLMVEGMAGGLFGTLAGKHAVTLAKRAGQGFRAGTLKLKPTDEFNNVKGVIDEYDRDVVMGENEARLRLEAIRKKLGKTDPERVGAMFRYMQAGGDPDILQQWHDFHAEAMGNPQAKLKVGKPVVDRSNLLVSNGANAYNESRGVRPIVRKTVIDVDPRASQIADAYEAMKHDPTNPAVIASYDALKNDVRAQWDYAQQTLGIKFEPWKKEGQPYKNSGEMMRDVRDNKHLWFFQGGEIPKDHPMAGVDPATKLSYNDMFRAIHDLFGHAAEGFEFGPKGEESAWNVHRQMFSKEAVPAMTTETRGQNSWVNYNRALRKKGGEVPKKGEPGYVPPAERPYAEQKAGLLPEEYTYRPEELAFPSEEQVLMEVRGTTLGLADKISTTLERQAVEARKRIQKNIRAAAKGEIPQAGGLVLTGALARDYAIIGASKIWAGARGFAKWSDAMVKEYGAQLKPYLRDIYNEARSILWGKIDTGGFQNFLKPEQVRRFIQEGKDIKDWYSDREFARMVKEEFKGDADIFKGFFAATGQGTDLKANMTLALKAYAQWKTGEPFSELYLGKANVERVAAGESLAGPKIGPYGGQGKKRGPIPPMVVDRRMTKAFFGEEAPNETQRKFISAAITGIGKQEGLTYKQAQAAFWKSVGEILYGGEHSSAMPSEILRAAFEKAEGRGTGLFSQLGEKAIPTPGKGLPEGAAVAERGVLGFEERQNPKKVVESVGGRYEGIQKGIPGQVPDQVTFVEPTTGSSAMLPVADLTPEKVQAKMEEVRKRFAPFTAKPEAPVRKTDIAAKLEEKYGKTTEVPDMGGGFILPTGEYTKIKEGAHDAALTAIGVIPEKRTGQIHLDVREAGLRQGGLVRYIFRTSRRGNELAVSVPREGITPEQVEAIQLAVDKMGENGNLVLEVGETGGKSTVKEFVRPEDVPAELAKIGVGVQAPERAPVAARPETGKAGFVERARETLDKLEVDTQKRIKDALGGAATRFEAGGVAMTASLLRDYSLLGAIKLFKTGMTFAQFSTDFIKEQGEWIKPHLRDIFEQAKVVLRNALPEDVRAQYLKKQWNPNEVIEHIQSGQDYAILQAENPKNQRIGEAENAQRTSALKADLEKQGYQIIEVEGNTKDVAGRTERAFFVSDISVADAAKIGRKYEQSGILVKDGIYWLDEGYVTPGDSTKLITGDQARRQDYFTVVRGAGGEEIPFNVPLDFNKQLPPAERPPDTKRGLGAHIPRNIDDLVAKGATKEKYTEKERQALLRRYRLAYEGLTTEEKAAAKDVREWLAKDFEIAHANGIVDTAIENYLTQIWDVANDASNRLLHKGRSGRFATNATMGMHRVFRNAFEGEMLGNKLKSDDPIAIAAAYHTALTRVIAARKAVDGLRDKNLRGSDGRPVVVLSGTGRTVEGSKGENPATFVNPGRVRSMRIADAVVQQLKADGSLDRLIAEGQIIERKNASGETYFAWDPRDFLPLDHPAFRAWNFAANDTAGNPVLLDAEARFHPEMAEYIKRRLRIDESPFRTNPVLRGALKANIEAKNVVLSFDVFHLGQEALRAVMTGINPFRMYERNLSNNPTLQFLVEKGLTNLEKDHYAIAQWSEGLVAHAHSKVMSKIPGIGHFIGWLNQFMFEKYIPGLKARASIHLFEKYQKAYPEWTREKAAEVAAAHTNEAFGGINWRRMGRSAAQQDAFRLVGLAPDWLESEVRYVARVFGNEGKIARQDMAKMALGLWAVARVMNYLTTGEPHNEAPFGVMTKDEMGRDKMYSVRTLPSDMLHMAHDPLRFLRGRLSPFITTTNEALTGRDRFGRRLAPSDVVVDIGQNLLPIALQSVGKRVRGVGSPETTTADQITRALGATVLVYRSEAQKKATELSSNRSESGPVEVAQLRKHKAKIELEDRLRSGQIAPTEIAQLVDNGQLSIQEAKSIYRNFQITKNMNPTDAALYIRASRLPFKDFLEIWDLATDEEKAALTQLMLKKKNQYLKNAITMMTPQERASDETYARVRKMFPLGALE